MKRNISSISTAFRLLAASILIVAAAQPAFAQKQTGGGAVSGAYQGGRGSIAALVRKAEIQNELELEAAQKHAIEHLSRRLLELEAAMLTHADRGTRTARPSSSLPQTGRTYADSFPALVEQANQEHERVVQSILGALTPLQRQRIGQLRLQELGAQALFLPEVAQALRIAPAQKEKMQEIWLDALMPHRRALQENRERFRAERRALRRNQGGAGAGRSSGGGEIRGSPADPEQWRRQHSEARRKADQRILEEVLTEEQRRQFVQMQGPAFSFNRTDDSDRADRNQE